MGVARKKRYIGEKPTDYLLEDASGDGIIEVTDGTFLQRDIALIETPYTKTELLVLDLVKKGLVTKQIVLTIGYDRDSLTVAVAGKTMNDTVYKVRKTGKPYEGKVTPDPYGRAHPRHAHGTGNLDGYTNSTRKIMEVVMELYTRIVDPDLLIRRLNISACHLIPESDNAVNGSEQLSLFTDYGEAQKKKTAEKAAEEKEKKIQTTMLNLQHRYGKNAILKGMNLKEGATTIERNQQVGGHKAE